MQILISVNNGLEYYEKYQKYLNKYVLWRALTFFSLLLLLGLVFLYSGLKEGFDSQTSESSFSENGKNVLTHTYNYYYHLPVGIGIALFIVFLYISLLLFSSFWKGSKRINKMIDKFDGREYKISISINDQTISYKDMEFEMQVYWSTVTKYKIIKDYIVLFSNPMAANHLIMILPYKQMTKFEYDETLLILNRIKKK